MKAKADKSRLRYRETYSRAIREYETLVGALELA